MRPEEEPARPAPRPSLDTASAYWNTPITAPAPCQACGKDVVRVAPEGHVRTTENDPEVDRVYCKPSPNRRHQFPESPR